LVPWSNAREAVGDLDQQQHVLHLRMCSVVVAGSRLQDDQIRLELSTPVVTIFWYRSTVMRRREVVKTWLMD